MESETHSQSQSPPPKPAPPPQSAPPPVNYSLVNKKLDPNSPFWLKKYTLLLKRTENIEKQNLRLLNRLYQTKSISKRLSKEKRFLMKRLDQHNDDYKGVKFYRGTGLSDILHEPENSNCPSTQRQYAQSSSSKGNARTKSKKSSLSNSTQKAHAVPKKPLNAFLWYCQEQRDVLLQQYPSMNHQELTKAMSKSWNTLDEKDKETYYEMFDKDRSRYEEEMKAYRLKYPDAPISSKQSKEKAKMSSKKEESKGKVTSTENQPHLTSEGGNSPEKD